MNVITAMLPASEMRLPGHMVLVRPGVLGGASMLCRSLQVARGWFSMLACGLCVDWCLCVSDKSFLLGRGQEHGYTAHVRPCM
jgi:hypothetical protein